MVCACSQAGTDACKNCVERYRHTGDINFPEMGMDEFDAIWAEYIRITLNEKEAHKMEKN